jgi:omega-6 fatty acid desaturase (delta-12 desaturase)
MKRFFQTGESANARLMTPTTDSNQSGNIPGLMTGGGPGDIAAWKKVVARYQQPSRWRAVWQIVNSLVPYAILWYLIHRSLGVSYWITLPLAILAGGFLVRLFIIHHDCGHGSFFKSRKANDIWGFITFII